MSIRKVDDPNKAISVEVEQKMSWTDSRVNFNESVNGPIMRNQDYTSKCLWYPNMDTPNFVSVETNQIALKWQRVSMIKAPKDGVSSR